MSAFIKSASQVKAIVNSAFIENFSYCGFNDFTGWNISEEEFYDLCSLCYPHHAEGFCIIHPDTRTVDIIDGGFKASKCVGGK